MNMFRLLRIRRAPSPADAARTLASIGPDRHRANVRQRAIWLAERHGRDDLAAKLARLP